MTWGARKGKSAAAQYKAEADKQINEQNASQELAKLEQEVAAEEADQP
jgi:hypothetical protein